MCYAGFENGRRICYADHATSENVLHPSRNCHRMCYAVKIRRYRPAVRTADVGKCATPVTQLQKMCYADHKTSANVLRRLRKRRKMCYSMRISFMSCTRRVQDYPFITPKGVTRGTWGDERGVIRYPCGMTRWEIEFLGFF